MFSPITAPSVVQTAARLKYRVVRVMQREEDEDPQQSRKSNQTVPKRNRKSDQPSDESQIQ